MDYRHAPSDYRPPGAAISLYIDIGQGAGLAGASGIRPFLPPLLAGGLARGDIGLDFDGTDWRFLESPGFLLAVLALAALSYGAERSAANRSAGEGSDSVTAAVGGGGSGAAASRGPLQLALAALGLGLGALLFAGSLADGGHAAWPGLIAGAACALLAWLALGGLLERTRRRLEPGAASMLALYAEGAALLVAVIAIALPPLSFLALAGFLLLLVRGRRQAGRRYAGLRILR
ncbi:MAG: hypothetical protein ABR581_01515 [Thermoleophilaceae bacterium]